MVTCKNAVIEALSDLGKTSTTSEIIAWIYRRYPEKPWKVVTIKCHLIGLSINHPSSKHYPTLHKQACLYQEGKGRYRLYEFIPQVVATFKKEAIVHGNKITINELKIACYLYERFTDYDKGYKNLRSIEELDLSFKDHSLKLLDWLRSWGCRQFKTDDTEMSIKNLTDWYLRNSKFLPDPKLNLLDGDEIHFDITSSIFDRLQNTKISERYNATSEVTVGPVGAAKILFALRPNFYSPWDRPICQGKGYQLDGHGYIEYLKDIQETLKALETECKGRGLELADLIKITNRPISTLPKLIDEFNWVTITNKCIPSEILRLIK